MVGAALAVFMILLAAGCAENNESRGPSWKRITRKVRKWKKEY